MRNHYTVEHANNVPRVSEFQPHTGWVVIRHERTTDHLIRFVANRGEALQIAALLNAEVKAAEDAK